MNTFKLMCDHRIELRFNDKTVGAFFESPDPHRTGTPLYVVEPIADGDVEAAASRVIAVVTKYLENIGAAS